MPVLQMNVELPYYLRLDPGDYQTAPTGEVIEVLAPILDEATPPRTPLQARFPLADTTDPEAIQRGRARCAEQLLSRANRLLRWYRAVGRRADITELGRAQVSPFLFAAVGAAPPEWVVPLTYEQPPPPVHLDAARTTAEVRAGLATGGEPGVAELFLLDAERALHQGGSREAVLFCWSTIDSVFNRRYARLANATLAGEWAEGRDFFTGIDYGLRHKMSAGIHLFAGRSLFREPDGFWNRLTVSYTKRNAIIHRGETASEDDARLAIDVARRVVEIMAEIPEPGGGQAVTAPGVSPSPEPLGTPPTRPAAPPGEPAVGGKAPRKRGK